MASGQVQIQPHTVGPAGRVRSAIQIPLSPSYLSRLFNITDFKTDYVVSCILLGDISTPATTLNCNERAATGGAWLRFGHTGGVSASGKATDQAGQRAGVPGCLHFM